MKNLIVLLSLFFASFALASDLILSPVDEVHCTKDPDRWAQWFNSLKILNENQEDLSFEFLAYYGQCRRGDVQIYEFQDPHIGLWPDSNMPSSQSDLPAITLHPINAALYKVHIKLNKSAVFRNSPASSYVIALVPNHSELTFYWTLSLAQKSEDTASQIVLESQ
ncbi:MAG: hypothetical protein KDD40_00940 [Bdellovibrionales bacterium]|nr:hypothetical protein [Bdellovibrionales bacterium]